ncbi:N-carbamoyl-D-amino acid hydrolase [Fulvia fulva]|uniref:N-carbamoyl-D-amino acid hydrolase n=1 Tax=Passalora fulva TaxID=5499 RepID=A0A9Q8LGI3_PASFU|nr:N-carbamoyl-D-amino acid hydrolase [Fulvia fulva]KAK4626727.1 N-carbamoyl-D-amino acid hydrolase [Fulvia fulva]KAK4627692.1 N-carbamoyl-D-amino acid hydrolase [Fulvia fulva]UJO16749.1 N-carbamoyl-D-amino acid hydrolase [Fulvia fulva]WPV13599.1 N-carbamoyl-D-amino acid hydrolase [Fulvia fulva]WPV28320.1 N-carbamoyl-D-amino acid hydrolase [Fulvia fulva]
MLRKITVAAAQVGAIDLGADKKDTVERLIKLLREAAEKKVQLVVYPEATLTTFFPRHFIESQEELDKYFEHGEDITQSPDVKPLFDEAKSCGIDIVIGYAERTPDGTGYNTSVYFSAAAGKVISKYRKVHLPGRVEPFEDPNATNQLEKRYFKPGDLGFEAFRAPGLVNDAVKKADIKEGESTDGKGDPIMGMLICNDRRWPEAWRVYTLQGAELLMVGYNTGGYMSHLWGGKSIPPEQAEKEALFHSRLVQQANSYMNACFSISSARCGMDDGKYHLIAGSSIVDPEGHVVAESKTSGDELVVAEVNLALCRQGKERTFDYGRHRRIETYSLITQQTGLVEPELL